MKVTSDDIIKSGERELIDGITADLDWEAVERIFREAHRLPLGEDVSYKSGDLVVHEDRIAYLLEFEVKVPLSLLLDREGSCIGIQAAPAAGTGDGEAGGVPSGENDPAEDASADLEGGDPLPEGDEDAGADPIENRLSEVREALTGMEEPDRP